MPDKLSVVVPDQMSVVVPDKLSVVVPVDDLITFWRLLISRRTVTDVFDRPHDKREMKDLRCLK